MNPPTPPVIPAGADAAATPAKESPEPARRSGTFDRLDRAVFGPAWALSCLVIVLAGAASLRVPIHRMTAPVAGVLVVAVFVLFWRWRHPKMARLYCLLGAFAVFASWLPLVEFSGRLLPAPADVLGLHPDNWSYQAMADYLDHYARGRSAGMPLVDEFGAHLQNTRFAGGAILAFLHRLPGLEDVALAHLVFVVAGTVAYFFSLLALCRALNHRENWSMPMLAAFFATAGGWLGHTLVVANDDNLIFAALSPALLAVCCPPAGGVGGWRPSVPSGGLLLGAMLYTYPEGLALLGVSALPLAVLIVWPGRELRSKIDLWKRMAGIGVVGALLAAPYLPVFAGFLRNQIAAGGTPTGGMRPGEGAFPGLVNAHRLPALFALGEEMPGTPYHLVDSVLPVCLGVLLMAGAWALGRRQRWFPWVALPLAGLFLWQSVAKHYDYGTYKVVIGAGWWIYPAISAGLGWIFVRWAWSWTWRAVAVVGLLTGVGWEKYADRRLAPPVVMEDRWQSLRELTTLRFVTGQAPVLLALDDGTDYMWATYFLRDLPLGTAQQLGYLAMPHLAPYMAQSNAAAPADCQFLLVSGARPDALWRNARFSLLRRPPIFVAALSNPANGVESVQGERFLWLGTQPATWQVIVPQAGSYELTRTAFVLGPSVPGRASVRVEITDAWGVHVVEVNGQTPRLPLWLAAGNNQVSLRCLDTPEPGPHSGDTRELMLGIQGPQVAASSTPQPNLTEIVNLPNGIERSGDKRFVWLGTQPATFRVTAPSEGRGELFAAAFVLGPSIPGQSKVAVEITDAHGTHSEQVEAATRHLPIFLAAGENVISLRCLGTPEPGPHNGDTRELVLGLLDPSTSFAPP